MLLALLPPQAQEREEEIEYTSHYTRMMPFQPAISTQSSARDSAAIARHLAALVAVSSHPTESDKLFFFVLSLSLSLPRGPSIAATHMQGT